MRGVLQLRTPESANGSGEPASSGVNEAAGAERSTPKVRFREPQIEMAHGAGGKATRRLVDGLFAPLFFDGRARELSDAAILDIGGARLALTTDSFVVTPLSFPGGSIGELAVN